MSVPLGLLAFALTIWVPNVRNYISESDGAVFAGLVAAGWMVIAVLPWWGQTVQDPIRTLARTVPIDVQDVGGIGDFRQRAVNVGHRQNGQQSEAVGIVADQLRTAFVDLARQLASRCIVAEMNARRRDGEHRGGDVQTVHGFEMGFARPSRQRNAIG